MGATQTLHDLCGAFQPGYVPIAVSIFLFFAAYHCYSTPYQALLPDVTPAGHHGKVQGYQALMRGIGMFVAIAVLGSLYAQWQPLPFIVCALMIMVLTFITVTKVQEPEPDRSHLPPREHIWKDVARVFKVISKDKGIWPFMISVFLWESTLAGVRPFILSYFNLSLGASANIWPLLLILVGVTYVVAGLLGGYLADRFGRTKIMRIGLWIYLGGCVLGAFMPNMKWAFIALPLFGLGGSIALTLPYAILIRMMPKGYIGQYTGMFSMMRGLATIIAPLITGAAIDLARPRLEVSHPGREYGMIWVVAAVMIVVSLFLFRGSDKEDRATAQNKAQQEDSEAEEGLEIAEL